jgi:uncharacterized protein (DUF362 family)
MSKPNDTKAERRTAGGRRLTRRDVLASVLAGGALGTAGLLFQRYYEQIRFCITREDKAETFIAKTSSYDADLIAPILAGMRELGIGPEQIRGKRILLKPNLIETAEGAVHIHTHPHVIRAAAEAMLHLGAAHVIVGEGSAHYREIARIADETGLDELLAEDNIPIVDLNCDDLVIRPNAGNRTRLRTLALPAVIDKVDLVVSMPKMKTHHLAGITLSMKNMFGLMPGIAYGWPKNLLHCVGINESILDINATLPAHLAIVDGIIGMEGDGPLAGTPKHAGTLVIGRNLPAVDATAARIMGVDPLKVPYLRAASGWLGTIREHNIVQRGETIESMQTQFQLLDKIPAHRGLRLHATRPDKPL